MSNTEAEQAPGRLRRTLAIILVIVAAVLVPLATVSVWVTRTAFDGDGFADVADGVISNPVVIDRAATRIADEVFDTFGPAVMDRVPVLFRPVVRVMSGSLHERIQGVAVGVLSSEAGQAVMLDAVMVAHDGALRVLEGRGFFPGDVVETDQGVITIDLVPLAALVLHQLQQEGILDDPAPGTTTVRAASEVAAALGFQLQDDFGQLVVYDGPAVSTSPTVARAQDALVILQRVQLALVIAAVVCLLAAVLIAVDRAKTVGRIGAGVALVSLALIALDRHVAGDVGGSVASPAGRAFAERLTTMLSSSLQAVLFTLVLVGASTAVLAWSAGHLGAVASRHADAARVVGVAVALLVVILLGFTWVSVMLAAAIVLLTEIAVRRPVLPVPG